MLVHENQFRISTAPAPRIRVLGPLRITGADGRPVALPGRLRRLAAGLLAQADTVASVDHLAEVVWGETQPVHVDAALQTLVSRLRSRLRGTGLGRRLLTCPPGYLFAPGPDDLDAAVFRRKVAEGRSALHRDPVAAAQLLDEGLALWAGDAYADFAGDGFATTEVAALHESRGVAVEERAEAALLAGRPEEALGFAERLLAGQPLRERAFGQVMTALCRTGRRAEALRRFDEYRRAIDEELGLEPSAALRELADRVSRQDPWLRPAAAVPPPRSEPPGVVDRPAGNIAPPRAPLVGREDDIAAVARRVRTGPGVVTLVGAGGIGKTCLALAVTARLSGEFPDGAWLVELSGAGGRAPVAGAVLDALRVDHPGAAPASVALLEHLRDKEALLVLDNAEHVVDDAAGLVEDVVSTCPGVVVLVTSRVPLAIPEERVHPVPPLATPAPGDDEGAVLASPAVRLFDLRASAAAPRFRLSGAVVAEVAELCRRLDGVPLAIELAAGRMGSLTPAEVVAMLPGDFALMPNPSRLAPDRHRTLRDLVEWSYRDLDGEDRAVFDRVCAFTGPFSARDAAEATGADEFAVTERIGSLVEKSLLVVDGSVGGASTRYAVLYPQRAYGLRWSVPGPRPLADAARGR